jgi:hypothetical protein
MKLKNKVFFNIRQGDQALRVRLLEINFTERTVKYEQPDGLTKTVDFIKFLLILIPLLERLWSVTAALIRRIQKSINRKK